MYWGRSNGHATAKTLGVASGDRIKKACRLRPGFSLVELMVVIVIIGLLASAVTVGVRSYLVAAKKNIARMEIAKISQALETFFAVNDRYPSNEEGIEILSRESDGIVDGLLNEVPMDPWGNAYQYNQPGRKGPFEIICYGADGREGGASGDADITSENLNEK